MWVHRVAHYVRRRRPKEMVIAQGRRNASWRSVGSEGEGEGEVGVGEDVMEEREREG